MNVGDTLYAILLEGLELGGNLLFEALEDLEHVLLVA